MSKYSLLLSLILLVACGPRPSSEVSADAQSIVDATLADGSLPFLNGVVAIGSDTFVWCTGSLISPKHVLTAAHCFPSYVDPSKVRIHFGADSSSAVRRKVVGVRIKPGFAFISERSVTIGQDLAVIAFTGGVPQGFKPIVLAEKKIYYSNGSPMAYAGYGMARAQDDSSAGVLRYSVSTFHESEKPTYNRHAMATVAKEVPGSWIWLDTPAGAKSTFATCKGDSGGPVLLRLMGEWVQAGITSSGPDDCLSDNIFVSVPFHIQWIRDTMKAL